jgi:hypothetical protein
MAEEKNIEKKNSESQLPHDEEKEIKHFPKDAHVPQLKSSFLFECNPMPLMLKCKLLTRIR